jgi:hypothetical protein
MADHLPSQLTRRRFLQGLLLGVPAFLAGAPSLFAARRLNELSLKFLSSVVPLNRRSAWAEHAAQLSRLKTAISFSRITVHHSGALVVRDTARGSVIDDLNSVLEAHKRIRYGDIGYHFVVDYAGRVWEGRSLSYEGAHVSSENEGNIGVMLLGNFEKQKPSAAQIETLGLVIDRLRSHFDIPARRVFGHRDIGSSVCPGKYLYPHVLALKSKKSRPTLA